MNEITLNSHAKLNLALRISGKRADGYHEIVSFMQGMGLHDVVRLKKCTRNATKYKLPNCIIKGVDVYLCTDAKTIPADMSNLAFKGIDALLEMLAESNAPWPDRDTGSLKDGLLIELDKRLPVAAGIAGGSGNAAVCMLGLNAMLGFPFDLKELMSAGASVGADVPFSIFMNAFRNCDKLQGLAGIEETADSAWTYGIGDIVEKADSVPMHVILANPGVAVSTKAAYDAMDSIGYGTEPAAYKTLFVNDFENYTFAAEAAAAELRRIMTESIAADEVLMSGSGPTIAAYYKDADKAKTDFEKLRKMIENGSDTEVWLTDTGIYN